MPENSMTDAEIQQHIQDLENIFRCGIYRRNSWNALLNHGERFLKKALEMRPQTIIPRRGTSFNDYFSMFQVYRILMGIGCELIVKAAFVKKEFTINKFNRGRNKNIIKLWNSITSSQLNNRQTVTFGSILRNIHKLFPNMRKEECNKLVRKGLETARIWRNKEVHTGGGYHREIGTDNLDIATSLGNIYDTVFNDLDRLKAIFREYNF